MFFIIKGLTRMDNMYQYSLAVFFRIFGQVMNLPSKMMNVLLQMMNFLLKMMTFPLKMMNVSGRR